MRIRHLAIASALSLAALVSAAPSALAQQAAAMKYCKADVARLCPGVQMGGGRIIALPQGAQGRGEHRLRQGAAGDESEDGHVRAALSP